MSKQNIVRGLFLIAAVFAIGLGFMLYRPIDAQAQNVAWPNPPYPMTAVNFAASGDNTVLASNATTAQCVYAIFFNNSDAATPTNITIKNGSTNLTGAMRFASGTAMVLTFQNNAKLPWFVVSPGSAFILNSSAAVQISGGVYAQTCP